MNSLAHRVHGPGGKAIACGLPRRGNRIHTEIVPNAAKAAPQDIILGKTDPKRVIHPDGGRGHDGPLDPGLGSASGSITATKTLSKPPA